MNLNQVTLPALDIEQSAEFYRRMGFLQIVDSPHYARFECGFGGASFSIHMADRVIADTGVVIYFETDRLEQRCAELEGLGFEFQQQPIQQRWLWHEARLKDPSGNVLCLYNAGQNRLYPPWRIEKRT